jgi:transposase
MSETKGIGCVPQGARTAQNEDAVFQAFKKDRTLSIRSIANMFNISKSTMQ